MNKKRIFTLLMAIVMVIGLVGCKNESSNETINTESEMTENTEATQDTTPVVDTIGWKVNPAEVENALPADVMSAFEATGMVYESMNFKPVAYLAQTDSGAYRILCHAAEDFAAKDVAYKLYTVTVKSNQIIDAHELDMTSLMSLADEEITAAMTSFAEAGWKHYMGQTASAFPTAVRNALVATPEDVEPIHFIAVHGAEDGTLTFAIIGHNAENLVMMFIAVPSGGVGELVNVVPIT